MFSSLPSRSLSVKKKFHLVKIGQNTKLAQILCSNPIASPAFSGVFACFSYSESNWYSHSDSEVHIIMYIIVTHGRPDIVFI